MQPPSSQKHFCQEVYKHLSAFVNIRSSVLIVSKFALSIKYKSLATQYIDSLIIATNLLTNLQIFGSPDVIPVFQIKLPAYCVR